MLITISTLPKELKNKIPLSIRLNAKNDILNTDELPFEIAYEFRNYKEVTQPTPFSDNTTIDLKPNFSVYTDFESITDKSKVVLEYIKNYILIGKGEYPFDPEFGNEIRKYLNVTESNTRHTLLNEEFRKIKNIAIGLFNIPITIKNFQVKKVDYGSHIGYAMDLFITVGELQEQLTVVDTKEEFTLYPNINLV